MRAVIQRVRNCAVTVDSRLTGSIDQGLLVYLGIGRNDSEKDARYVCDKIVNLRIFVDAEGKMNRSVRDEAGGVLVVSQFTLYGDAREGRRPSYSDAAAPADARTLYEHLLRLLRQEGLPVANGEFQASMEVTYTNVGPVTILLDSEKRF